MSVDKLARPISKVIPFLKSAVVSRNEVLELTRGFTGKKPLCIKEDVMDRHESTMIATIISKEFAKILKLD